MLCNQSSVPQNNNLVSVSFLPANPLLTFERIKQLDELIAFSQKSKKALQKYSNVEKTESVSTTSLDTSKNQLLQTPSDSEVEEDEFSDFLDDNVFDSNDLVYSSISPVILRQVQTECEQAEQMLKKRILSSTVSSPTSNINDNNNNNVSASVNIKSRRKHSLASPKSKKKDKNQHNKNLLLNSDGYSSNDNISYTTRLSFSPNISRKTSNFTLSQQMSKLQLLEQEELAQQQAARQVEMDKKNLQKARHIITELIETETSYIRQLQMITSGYIKAIERSGPDIPKVLIGKTPDIFATWESIEKFHIENIQPIFCKKSDKKSRKKSFEDPFSMSSSLFKNFEQVADLLAEFFTPEHIQEMEDYYFEYSHNLRSAFRSVSNEKCQNFFKIQQRKLKHPLPIDAYLLIPVQRIAKYPLLINKIVELYDHENDTRISLLRSHSAVHHLMQAVNNRLHASAINVASLPEDVALNVTTGCHIHQQAVASVQIEKLEKNKSKSNNNDENHIHSTPNVSRTLRMSRPANRRIFLTDKFLLLTKARENLKSESNSVQDDLTSCLDTLPGGNEQYDFKDVFDLSFIEGISGYGKRVVVSMATLRYFLTFESESDRELWKEVLEIRKNKRKTDTRGPLIGRPQSVSSPKNNDSKKESSESNNSSVISSFRRAFSRSSLRRKNKHAVCSNNSSSSSSTMLLQGVQRDQTNLLSVHSPPHNRQSSSVSHSSDLGISTRSESSESGNSSNFTRNKVVTTSFRLRQSQLYRQEAKKVYI